MSLSVWDVFVEKERRKFSNSEKMSLETNEWIQKTKRVQMVQNKGMSAPESSLQLLRPMRFTCVDTHCDISCVHQFLLGMFFQFVSGTEI